MFYSKLLVEDNLNNARNDEMKQLWEKHRDSEPKNATWHDSVRDLVVAITDRLQNEALFEWNEKSQDYDDRFTYEPNDSVWLQFKSHTCTWSDVWSTAGAVSAAQNRFLSFASSCQSTDFCGDLIYFEPSTQKIYVGMLCCESQVCYKVLDRDPQFTAPPVIDTNILCFETYSHASSYDNRITNDFWSTTEQILGQKETMAVTDSYWWQLELVANHLFNDGVLNRVCRKALQYCVAQRFNKNEIDIAKV